MPKSVELFLPIIVCLSVAQSAQAANHLKDGLLAVNKALAQVRSAGGDCQGKALAKMKDARDALNMARGKANLETFSKSRRAVEDAMDEAGNACAGGAQEAMQAALESLQQGLDAFATAAETPSPAEQNMREKRNCWNYTNDWSSVDPACHVTRDGHYPIGKDELNGILGKLHNTPDRFGKTSVMDEELGYSKKRYVSSLQLRAFLQGLLHDVDRLETVKLAADRLVDPKNAHTALDLIGDQQIRKEAMRVITEAAD